MKNIIRPIKKADEDFLYLLRNNNKVRKESLNSNKISLYEHKLWMKKKLKYKYNLYFIILKNKQKIGFIRYDKTDFFYNISVAILPKYQKSGLATLALIQSESYLKNNIIFAKIKRTNKKSQLFFIKNGYRKILNNKIDYYFKFIDEKQNKNFNLIDQIENIRGRNNINWMNILRIAFETSPEKTKSVFKKIFVFDKNINKLSRKLFS